MDVSGSRWSLTESETTCEAGTKNQHPVMAFRCHFHGHVEGVPQPDPERGLMINMVINYLCPSWNDPPSRGGTHGEISPPWTMIFSPRKT